MALDGVILEHGDRVVVTGAAGFVGSAIARALVARGARVVAAVEPGADVSNLAGLDVERVTLDIRDRDGVFAAVRGARAVFHAAALYRFWAPDPEVFYAVNVQGSRNVLEGAVAAGVGRVVYTSTVGTIGLPQGPDGRAESEGGKPGELRSSEAAFARAGHLYGMYKQSKYVAEHEVLRAAAEGAPVCIVLPTFPLGPRDRRPTPTGKVVLDFLNGRIPGYVDTAMNVAHVDDVANAHLLALERGRIGRSYIAGGENLSMLDLLCELSSCTGVPMRARRFPRAVGLSAGYLSELLQGRLLGTEPAIPREAARMSTTRMVFDDSRARAELGYTSRPATEAIAASARWFVEHGYVRPARYARIRLSVPCAPSETRPSHTNV
jgi:dihydroflavonol-4-reductase